MLTVDKRAVSLGVSALIVIALIVIVGFGAYLNGTFNNTRSVTNERFTTSTISNSSNSQIPATSTISTSLAVTCFITGQANGIYLRVLSDSTNAPVSGANVAATSKPVGVNGVACGKPQTSDFSTTSNTMWYSFAAYNIAGYSFTVTYSGQTYNLTANLEPLSTTCATLFVPSGNTNITTNEYTNCSSPSSTTYSSLAESQTFLHVTCCITLPQTFIVGGYSFKDYVFAPPPPTTTVNGTIHTQMAGVLLVFVITYSGTSQNVSFTWAGTFSEIVPSPSSATAFNGRVAFQWYANTTGLYVGIATYSSGSISTQSYSQQQTTIGSSSSALSTVCTPAIILNQTSTTETITLCHVQTTTTISNSTSGG